MIFNKVVEIICEQLEFDNPEEITPTTSLVNDLEADSLDAVEVIMALEDEFDIEISDEDAEGFKNIGDIANYIENKTK